MNKKHIYARNFLCCFFSFLVYFFTVMSFFLVSRNGEEKSIRSLSFQLVSKMKESSAFDVFSFYSDDEKISLSLYDPLSSLPSVATKGHISPLSEVLDYSSDKVYFLRENSKERTFFYVRLEGNRNIFLIKKDVSVTYSLAKGFFIYGTIFSFLLSVLVYFLLLFSFKHSLKPLKLQIRKLQDISQPNHQLEINDDLNYLSSVLRDSRHRLRKELEVNRISDQKMNFILDSFSEGLIVIDSSYKIVIINKKALEIFSLDRDEVKDRHMENIKAPHDLEVNFSMVIHTNKSISFIEKINSRVYQCDINSIDYTWTRGITNEKNGASLVLIDITDDYNSNSMKKEFFANASHELKSPLTSILGYLQLIENHTITKEEDILFALQKCVMESKRMNKIISDMLTLSAIEKESLRTIEEIDVPHVIDNILSSLKPQAESRNIKIEREYHPLVIKMNSEDFDRIARNLLDNAIKYNKENGTVKVIVKEDSLLVSDTGIGISKENQSRVFERFFRVDKARSRKNGDTGLGLSIVKHLCNYYDCSLSLQSVLGEGSTFLVKFPKD